MGKKECLDSLFHQRQNLGEEFHILYQIRFMKGLQVKKDILILEYYTFQNQVPKKIKLKDLQLWIKMEVIINI